ncbi:thioredoxin [Candidatus Woesebacteria bacterium]|nr:thioredoxin [Candidatus Woesebacteria bacterium]
MAVTIATKGTFQQEVINQKGVTLVDFFAEWCGPCKATGPIIDVLSEEMKDVKFVKVDVDSNQELAGNYSVFSIPTFLIFQDGVVKTQFVGAHSKEGFEEEIKKVTG